MTKFLNFLRKQPLLTGVFAVALVLLGNSIPHPTHWNTCILRLLMCGVMLFLLYLISGEKSIFYDNHQIGYTFKRLMGYVIFALVMGVMFVVVGMKNGIEDGLPLRLVTMLPMFVVACLFEELCFRAVLNDAIVYQLRNSRRVFVISAVVSSLVFGVVHVMGGPLTSAVEWAQFILKTLACAIPGFAFLLLYWKTRDIWAVALVHASYDILTQLSSIILGGGGSLGVGSYVVGGQMGVYAIGIYAFQIVITGVITLRVWKKVGKTIDFEAMRKSW